MLFLRKKLPIDEFWQWFKANRQRLQSAEVADEAAYRQLRDQLRSVHRSLTYEIVLGEVNELQISADGIPELIEVVREVVLAAPAMKGWRVVPFRQPQDKPVEIDVFDQVLNATSVRYRVEAQREGAIDITVFIPGLTEENYRHMAHCAMMIMESVIGEYPLMTKVGEIEYEPAESDADTVPVSSLRVSLGSAASIPEQES
jgi:hypothetical protein